MLAMLLPVVITIPSRVLSGPMFLLQFFSRLYKSRSVWDCVYKFLQYLIFIAFFLFYNSFNMSPSLNVFCNSSFAVDPSFCIIGSLPPSNSLFDIIVDLRLIVDGGSSFWDVSSACTIDSVLENFKS